MLEDLIDFQTLFLTIAILIGVRYVTKDDILILR